MFSIIYNKEILKNYESFDIKVWLKSKFVAIRSELLFITFLSY